MFETDRPSGPRENSENAITLHEIDMHKITTSIETNFNFEILKSSLFFKSSTVDNVPLVTSHQPLALCGMRVSIQ